MRWRFQPGSLKINEKSNKEFELRVKGKEKLKMNISSTIPFSAVEISKGWESQFYLLKTELPVLEIKITKPGVIKSELIWSS